MTAVRAQFAKWNDGYLKHPADVKSTYAERRPNGHHILVILYVHYIYRARVSG